MIYSPTAIARQFQYVREIQPNKGMRVNAIQTWCGGISGDSWCAFFATMVLDIAFQGKSPVTRAGSCNDIYNSAKARGWITETPNVDDLFLYINHNGIAHHIGIVTDVYKEVVTGIAGNTSKDGKSVNGDGVYEHVISMVRTVFINYPKS